MTEENLILPAIELPHPHGFLVWRGKQKALINKAALPVGQEIAIVSDGEYFGTVVLDEAVPVTEQYLTDEFESHRLKNYEHPTEKCVVQNIVSLEKMKDTVAARVDEGLLVIDDLPELDDTGLHLWNNAKDLPTTIILERGAIKVTQTGEVVGKAVNEELLETLKRNYDMDLEHVDKAAASSALSLYDVTLTRTPNMRFKYIEPPNLRFADSPDSTFRCKNCEYFKQGLCELYGVTVDENQVCDSFDPKYEGTVVMLPIPMEIAQRLVLTEKDVPMGSELMSAEDLHITLYYEHELELETLMELPQVLHYISQSFSPPTIQVQGIGKFELVEDGEKDVIKLGIDSPEIKMMHTWLMSYLGIDPDEVTFSAHISLAYVPVGSPVPNVNYYRDTFLLDEIVMNVAGGTVFSAMFEDNSNTTIPEEEIMGKEAVKMPYEMIEQDGQYCVIKPETGEIEECYDNEEEAQALLTALQINVEDSKQKEGRRLQGKWLTTLSKLYEQLGELVSWAKREDEDEYKMHGFGIKETEQGPIFYTYSSNAFEDRDREIITTQALEEFVVRNSENENKGYFNYWHVRSSDFAEKRWQGMIGRILVEAGPFLKNKKGRAAYKFFKKHTKNHPVFAQEGWGASIEFIYLPEQAPTGEYKWLHITRTSVLPLAKAANINTTSTIIGGNKMALTDQQVALGKEIFGEDLFNEIETQAEDLTKQLEKTTRYKEADKVEEEVTEPVVEETTEEEVTELVEEEETAVEEETIAEESTEEVVETAEVVEEDNVEEEVVAQETDETPVTISTEDVIEQVSTQVAEVLKQGLKDDLAIINSFPEQLQMVMNRLDNLEAKSKAEEAVKPRSLRLFSGLEQASVTGAKDESSVVKDEDVKKAGPVETEALDKEEAIHTGKIFFQK